MTLNSVSAAGCAWPWRRFSDFCLCGLDGPLRALTTLARAQRYVVQVAPQVDGQVMEVAVADGDRVERVTCCSGWTIGTTGWPGTPLNWR
ncbi:biotin/lipoyl-binding protein [Alcanivorax sp. IO_7]|nr:biotin/lipoyl-binding protein [Alcanivorax sp. IO_7]